MKVAKVPAQITTVEDRIAGNLNLEQLLLLMVPLFGGNIVYIIFPPSLHFAIYKIVSIIVFTIIFGFMAIRVKEKILLQWLVIMLRYKLRPRYHIFDKNDMYLRNKVIQRVDENGPQECIKIRQPRNTQSLKLVTADIVKIQQIVSNPRTNLSFKPAKRGGIRVLITETKQ